MKPLPSLTKACSPQVQKPPGALRRWAGTLTAACVAVLAASTEAAPPTEVNLHKYVCVARYDLPEPTRTPAPPNSILAQECSSTTYNWDTDTLFVVGDGGTAVVQITKTGQLINSMSLATGSSPQGTEFYDTEGITYVGGGKFVFSEERDRQVNLFTYVPDTILTRADVQTVKLGTSVGNIGIEGLCFDPVTGGFIVVKEKDPQAIFSTTIDFVAGTASNGSPTTTASTNLFPPSLANLADLSDVCVLANIPSLVGTPDGDRLLVLSQESGQIINVDRSGVVHSRLTIVAEPTSTLTVPDMTMEGVTMDKDGFLYVVNENGGGDSNHPQVWVYAPSEATNTAPAALALTSAVLELPDNSSTSAPIKIANVSLTDDGLGANNLTVTGTDAEYFQIIGAALYLKAGTSLNRTTKPTYHVSVSVDDPSVGGSPDVFADFTLTITAAPVGTAALIISEVAPWSSGNSLPSLTADWFEVTNTGTATADITGWRVDDTAPTFATAIALSGVTSIAPGESVIFMEIPVAASTPADVAAKKEAFLELWFKSNRPTNLQVGYYSGAGIGLGTGGDAVNLYDSEGTIRATVAFGTSPTAAPFGTFDNAIGLNNATITTLSAVGVNGAFVAASDPNEIGSPGTIGFTSTPVVIVNAVDASAAEAGSDSGTFRFTRSGGPAGALTVNYTIETGPGQAIAADYTPVLTGSVTIPAGSAFVDVEIVPVDDALFEGAETVTVTIFDSGNYDVGALPTATVTIADNEGNLPPTAIALSNAAAAISENTSTASAVKVADIAMTDDGNGANNLTLTGPDANFFQITGSALFLKAGTTLSSITKPSYNVTVNVDDPTVGITPDASVNYTLNVLAFVTPGSIIISEVHPQGSSSAYAADWFEITNIGTTDVNIAGWRFDDSSDSFAAGLPLRGVTVIPAGKSAVFFESNATGTNDATIATNFSNAWFGTPTLPSGFLIGFYGGSGIGLSGSGDGATLFDAAQNRITAISFGAASTTATFDNKAGLGTTMTPYPAVSQLSVAGVNGAFLSANGLETGSPGRTVPFVAPGTILITEVHSSGSSSPIYGADWFEVTNIGTTDVDISGWRVDDSSNSYTLGVALRGVTAIPAGRSAVFFEGNAAGTNVATITANFSTAWFGSPVLPNGFLIGSYGGGSTGLSSGGDAVVLFDAAQSRVTGVSFGAGSTTVTFDNKLGLGTTAAPFPLLTTLSAVGINGAYVSSGGETGSPGTTRSTWTMPTGQPVSSLATPLNLAASVNTLGGTFSGTGVTAGGIFDPGKVGPGVYTVTYTVNGVSSSILIRVVAPPVITPAAIPTQVLSFDGTGRYVDAGTGIALANASFTIEFWAKRGMLGGEHIAVNQGLPAAGTDGALFIGFRSMNAFSFGFFNDNLDTTATYTDAAWHHWACTYDAASKERRIYRDGAQVASGLASANFQGVGNFIIGANYGGTSQFFNGLLAEVRVWNAARNASQIAAKMFDAPAGNEADLVAYWPLDDGSGTTLADYAVGHANPGTLVGGNGWQSAATSFGPILLEINSPFADPGASAVDGTNSPLAVTTTNDVVMTAAGFYGIVYSATDPVTGIIGTVRRAVEVADRTAPPPPEVLSPANGSTVSGATTVISGNAEPGSTVKLTITGAANLIVNAIANGGGQFATAPLNLGNGAYSVTAVATDAAGNTSGALPATTFSKGALPAVQAGISVTRGGFVMDRATGLFVQTDTLKNTTTSAIAGPVYLVLDSLSANATLSSKTGITTQVAPLNSPYVQVVGPTGSLAPGASIATTLKFTNPTKASISYTTRTLSGGNVAP